MKILFSLACLLGSLAVFAQLPANAPANQIVLTQDLVLTETLVVETPMTYMGNGFSISCDGCDPMIRTKPGVRVHFESVRFKPTYVSWLTVEGGALTDVTWNSPALEGQIQTN